MKLGTTLLELLVVLSIIALLASVAALSLPSSVRQAGLATADRARLAAVFGKRRISAVDSVNGDLTALPDGRLLKAGADPLTGDSADALP